MSCFPFRSQINHIFACTVKLCDAVNAQNFLGSLCIAWRSAPFAVLCRRDGLCPVRCANWVFKGNSASSNGHSSKDCIQCHVCHVTSCRSNFSSVNFYNLIYVHVSVLLHPNKLLLNKTNRRTNFPNLFLSRNSTCFGQFLYPSSGFFHRTFVTGLCHAGLMTAFKHDQDGRAWKLSSKLQDINQCRMYGGKILMMGIETVRNM